MTMTKLKNNIGELEDVEFGVDSRYASKAESKSESKSLKEARLERRKHLSSEQITKARLLQLKLRMEAFISEPIYEEQQNVFPNFLAAYIDTIYSKRKNFAKDIDITPILLSQILNNHREPKEEFMLRLMIHSGETFKMVCEFDEKTWYQVYYQEKMCEMMANQNEWRPKEERHVQTWEPKGDRIVESVPSAF
jgi:hypothetical protein